MQNTQYSAGPKFFGTSAKKSWFDEGDRCSPGPGAHDPKRLNATNPPEWSAGHDTERDTFLEKYPRPNPSPDRYKVVDLNKTHTAMPNYSVPVYEKQQNPNKIDEGNSLDYRPRYNVPKEKYPDYSFGYTFERDYSTGVPPPNTYNPKRVDPKSFNRTQRSFSIGNRPTPYGEQGKYPYVGKYNVSGDMGGSKYTVGNGDRPDYTVGASPGKFYNISGDLRSKKGKTIGMMIEVPKNKDQQDFPAANFYNPNLPNTTRNIINYRSQRSQIHNPVFTKNPSPDKYERDLLPKQQTVSFTKQKRYSPEPNDDPGVGTYQIEKKFNKTLGHMGLKLKKLSEFINPAPSAYNPKEDLTKPTPQRPINLYSDRTDFSKSITGFKVGPGVYEVRKRETLSLGKMAKGAKFDPNRNKNPGPGSYEIPNGIGKLPKYCSGPKKLSTTGFSFIELQRQQKIRMQRSKVQAKKEAEQKMQEQILQAKESQMSVR